MYMLMIYQNEKVFDSMNRVEQEDLISEYNEYTGALIDRSKIVAGEALENSSSAMTVRFENGGAVKEDGPAHNGDQQFSGFYVIDVENFQEALDWAAEIPDLKQGASVEVRAVVSY